MFEPWRSASTTPASLRTRRWCETVGWRTSQQVVKSHAQTSFEAASSRTIARRTGSASAVRSWTSGSRWRVAGGFEARVMASTLSTNFDIDKHQYLGILIGVNTTTRLRHERSHQMYPLHLAGVLRHAEDPREARNRT